jgi:hypothetical protein
MPCQRKRLRLAGSDRRSASSRGRCSARTLAAARVEDEAGVHASDADGHGRAVGIEARGLHSCITPIHSSPHAASSGHPVRRRADRHVTAERFEMRSTMTGFAARFDASCAARWPDNTAVAAAIRKELAGAGLGRTNRVQISRWRNGLTAPSLAVQNVIVAWLQDQRASDPGAAAQARR